MKLFDKTLVTVTVQQLTDASQGEAVMSYVCYQKLAYRGRISVIRQGKGLGNCALVDYDSLPTRFKQRYIAKYGDPHMQKNKEQDIRLDTDARTFFEEYTLSDGTHIKGEKIAEFTLNATVLNMLIDMEKTQGVQRRLHGNRTPINWPPIYEACEELREDYGHTLPRNTDRLRDKMREYKRDGYVCLVSGRLVNANACKITDEGGRFIIALKCSRTPVYNNAQILSRYNAEAPERGWKQLKTQAALVNYLSRPEVEIQWKASVIGDTKAKMKYTRQHSTILPTLPNALWYGDGTRLNLFYKHYKDGRYQLATLNVYEVIDAASEVFLGCHVSNTENFESIYEATRAALEFAGCKPYEYVTDNQGGTRRADAQLWLKQVATLFRTTAPHQAPAKTIESVFGRFQAQVLHQEWYYTGGNITAKSEAAKIHREFIEKNIDKLPTYNEVVETYMKARQRWNAMQHPDVKKYAGRSRMEVYTAQVNPEAVPLTDAIRRDLFWVTTAKPSTFTAYGIWFTVAGEKLQYEVMEDGTTDVPDLRWRGANTGREFYVSYDPHDLSVVRLMTKDQYGYRFVCEARPYRKIHRALQDQTEQERSFIRQQDERNKIDRIQRSMDNYELMREFGLAPDQHGMVDPGLAGLNESKRNFERLMDKAEAERRSEHFPEATKMMQKRPEPFPAQLYPDTIGQQEKADSMLTQYDEAAALSRI